MVGNTDFWYSKWGWYKMIEYGTYGRYVRWIPSQEVTDDWEFASDCKLSLFYKDRAICILDSLDQVEILLGHEWANFGIHLNKIGK